MDLLARFSLLKILHKKQCGELSVDHPAAASVTKLPAPPPPPPPPIIVHGNMMPNSSSKQTCKIVHCDAVLRGASASNPASRRVRIIHISDTHCRKFPVPDGDVLIHTGDFTNSGTEDELREFSSWFASLPHPHKLVIGGNHEYGCDKGTGRRRMREMLSGGITYLEDSGVEIHGIRFWGTPWNNSSQAWGVPQEQRASRWDAIPADTDVLLTHVPPHKILDLAWTPRGDQHWGCKALLHRVRTLAIPIHCFGHVHDEVGVKEVDGTLYSNAAMAIFAQATALDVWVPEPASVPAAEDPLTNFACQ